MQFVIPGPAVQIVLESPSVVAGKLVAVQIVIAGTPENEVASRPSLEQIIPLAAIEKINIEKSKLLYDYLDSTSFYSSPVARDCRSLMNVPFKLPNEALDGPFLKGAEERGMLQLKGHRSVGGMRASIYNAMPIEGVQRLVEVMRAFEAKHG